jgi:uncharacterized protein
VRVDPRRNNLDRSVSPYLRQHRENPVWWQEWAPETLASASAQQKPVFVSIGYSTCHWCHVMASEAFSDASTAEFLNRHFVCIKVDRETRPDIDQVMMRFIQEQTGGGGWPLNAFLTSDLRPIYALTYAPSRARGGRLSLIDVARKVHEYFTAHKDEIRPFHFVEEQPEEIGSDGLRAGLLAGYDPVYGGFGREQKFPPHSTMLYMLYRLCVESDPAIEKACRLTLDSMCRGGLRDHLQGGIFRYCVDRRWTIPHFEKMLYDQAMALWCFALARRVLGNAAYQDMAEGIVRCLERPFARDGLFATAFDADTNHREGLTYVWTSAEIKAALSDEEWKRFAGSYQIPEKGNFEGAIHLARIDDRPLPDIEAKLLALRDQRPQPAGDDKILCGINALTACGMVQAARLLDKPELEGKAAQTVQKLVEVFWDGSSLAHSLANGTIQKQGFLTDASALLLALTMLREADDRWTAILNDMARYVASFREGERWIESSHGDFQTVHASGFDHPVPSAVSLATMGLTRAALLVGAAVEPIRYRSPLHSDFFNIAAMISRGLFHQIHARQAIDWRRLPANSLQIRDKKESDCYRDRCVPLGY